MKGGGMKPRMDLRFYNNDKITIEFWGRGMSIKNHHDYPHMIAAVYAAKRTIKRFNLSVHKIEYTDNGEKFYRMNIKGINK